MGNMISDFVKGRKKFDYPTGIQKGIALHRAIDTYTDIHPATREAKEVFRPAYRLYSGAFVDVIYDHFLAVDKREFTEITLYDFSQQIYAVMETHLNSMPVHFADMFTFMREQNWLYNYRTRWGTAKSLGGVVRRSTYLHESDTAFELFEKHYQLLNDCYRHFWEDVKPFARAELDRLLLE